jgi:hypothetical protein
MDVAQAIASIECAEDLFALLDVPFDATVLGVHRVHILKRFGQELDVLERRRPPLTEAERLPLYAAALQRTHALYASGGSEVDPFVRPRARDLVPVDRLRRSVARDSQLKGSP